MAERRRLIFRPFTILYLILLAFLLVALIPIAAIFLRNLLVEGIGIPLEAVGAIFFLSLVGSYINIPITTLESKGPIYTTKEVRLFWVKWQVPTIRMGVRKTVVAINLGGGIVPLLISGYLLIFNIPRLSDNPVLCYIKTAAVLAVVSYGTYKTSRLVKGLGIATPAFGPPILTALSTFLVDMMSPMQCPAQIAYIGGTLGVLIGADLLNLPQINELGAPMVSIGGAGTFDGVFLTGLISVTLVLLLI